MADNVAITAGAGTTVATDDVAGVHYQRVKLVDGTLDSSAAIPGDASNGLDVDVTRLPPLVAGSAGIGSVIVTVLPALAAGTANIGDVDVLTLPALPAGDNNIGNVDVVTLPALPAGTNAIGKLAANSGVDIGDVDVLSLPAIPAGTNTIGSVDLATPTSGGVDTYSRLSTADENAVIVKASPGCIFGWYSTNTNNGAPRLLKIYDKATAPTSGDTPVLRILLPGSTAGAGGAVMLPRPKAFAAGIAIRIVTGSADNDATAPAANEVIANLFFK